jgi:hypothetical protein
MQTDYSALPGATPFSGQHHEEPLLLPGQRNAQTADEIIASTERPAALQTPVRPKALRCHGAYEQLLPSEGAAMVPLGTVAADQLRTNTDAHCEAPVLLPGQHVAQAATVVPNPFAVSANTDEHVETPVLLPGQK